MMKKMAYRLREICDIVAGGTPATRNDAFWNGEISWITPADLSQHHARYIFSGERNITDIGLKKSAAKLLPVNTVLLTTRAPIGYIAIAGKEISTNQGFKNLICKKELVDYQYLYYWLSVNIEAIKNFATGATFPELSGTTLGRIKICVPDLSTQTKIADILSAYDDAIENNNRRIKILEQMAENLYKEWFVRMRFPGHETAEYENGLPKGWGIKRIEAIGEVVGGGTPSTSKNEYWNGDIPWLTPADLSDNTRVFVRFGKSYITALGLKSSGAKLLPANTVLLSSRAPVGYVAISANPISTYQGFKSVIRNNSIISPYYLYFYLKYHREMLENYATGATFPELSATRLRKIKILVPDIDWQHYFTKIIQPMLQTANDIEEQNIFLARQRDLLLPRLMSGKMEI